MGQQGQGRDQYQEEDPVIDDEFGKVLKGHNGFLWLETGALKIGMVKTGGQGPRAYLIGRPGWEAEV
jgi:hypothetical protein